VARSRQPAAAAPRRRRRRLDGASARALPLTRARTLSATRYYAGAGGGVGGAGADGGAGAATGAAGERLRRPDSESGVKLTPGEDLYVVHTQATPFCAALPHKGSKVER
jgi:hypothetical protein